MGIFVSEKLTPLGAFMASVGISMVHFNHLVPYCRDVRMGIQRGP